MSDRQTVHKLLIFAKFLKSLSQRVHLCLSRHHMHKTYVNMFRLFYGRVGVSVLCLCAKTCTLGTCTYLNIAYYHPSIPHAPSPSPASHFLCPLFMFCVFFFLTLLTLFVRFACQSALNIVALLLQFAATVMLGSHGQVGSRQGGKSG